MDYSAWIQAGIAAAAGLLAAAGGLLLTRQKQRQLDAESDKIRADTIVTYWQSMQEIMDECRESNQRMREKVDRLEGQVLQLTEENKVLRGKLRELGVNI